MAVCKFIDIFYWIHTSVLIALTNYSMIAELQSLHSIKKEKKK